MKHYITVSKKWNNPEIKIYVSADGIELKMDIEDLKAAIKKEIGSITWTFKQATFEQKVDEAIDAIIEGIKQESAKVMV